MLNCFVVLSLILPRSISTVSSGTETMWSSSGEWCCQWSRSHVSVFQIYSQWRSPHHSVPDSRYQPTLSLISCWPGLCSRNGVARLLQSHSHCPGQCEVRGWRRIQVWSVSGSSQVLHSSQNNSSTSCWWVSRHCSCDSSFMYHFRSASLSSSYLWSEVSVWWGRVCQSDLWVWTIISSHQVIMVTQQCQDTARVSTSVHHAPSLPSAW